jgi:hypothetical protein
VRWPVVRLSAGTARPRSAPGERLRFVDMRHRSTPGDRATVRVGVPQGQTRPAAPAASLWMTACRAPGPLVTFAEPRFPAALVPASIAGVCDGRHMVVHTPLTCRNSVRHGSQDGLGPDFSTTERSGSQPVDKVVEARCSPGRLPFGCATAGVRRP